MARRRLNRILKITLIALTSLVALAIAVGAIYAGVIESERTSAARKMAPTTRPTAAASLEVVRPTAAPKTAASVPAPTATTPAAMESTPITPPSPAAVESTAYAPEVFQTVEARIPAAPTVPRMPAAQPPETCPSGAVTAALDSITFEWPYSTLPDEVTVVGRGTLHNGTTAAIQIPEYDVPDLDGLDSKGQIAAIETYGEYDWAPPPGVPSGGYVVLQPGESVTYVVKDSTLGSMIVPVTHWYSATESGSVQMYYDTASSLCTVTGMEDASGKAIANTFIPRS
jgi:hypothetical protein